LKRSKYGNKKTIVDGIKFDSKKEAQRYCDLKMLLNHRDIEDLVLQPRFDICPTHKWNGKTQRKKSYVADFKYTMNGVEIVEDVKGMRTALYILKRSLFLTQYPQYTFIET
jgi:hypothetical protein